MTRNNAVPLALIGLGVGWLIVSGTAQARATGQSSTWQSLRRRAGEVTDQARHRVQEAAETVRHTAEDIGERARDTLHSAQGSLQRTGDGAQGQARHYGLRARQAGQGFWDMVDAYPLVAGVMGLALGAAIGASIPSSRAEERWLGDFSEDILERTREAAGREMERSAEARRTGASAAAAEAEAEKAAGI